MLSSLGGVDKFEPVSGRGDVDHAEKGFGELVVAGSNGAIDFEMTEHALNAVALFVEGAVVLDFHASVGPSRNYGLDVACGKVRTDRIGIVALVCEQCVWHAFGQIDQRIIRLAIC